MLARAVVASALSVGLSLGALGPFEKNHPLVEEGMEAYDKGDYQRALERFEAAKKQLPRSATVEYNRGAALFKLGRYDEAKEAFRHVAEVDQGSLRQKDYYNLGNAWAAMGNRDEAIAAFRKALTLDPNDQLARHNLEVLLRRLPPKQSSGPDGGTPDGGSSDGGRSDAGSDGGQRDGGQDGGRDGGADGGRGDGGVEDGGQEDGGRQDGGQKRSADGGQGDGGSDGGQSEQGQSRIDAGSSGNDGGIDGGLPDEGTDGGSTDGGSLATAVDGGADLSKRDAEKLLDSMKNNEKNLQLWRFQQRQRKPSEKDW